MTLEILRNFIQSSNINFLYGSGISRPYLSTLGNIEKWLTKLAEDITQRATDTNPTLQIVVFAYSDKDLETYKKNLEIEHGCSNNNILILTPSSFKEANQDKYNELCEMVGNFDLKTINLLFKEISKNIHSGYGTK